MRHRLALSGLLVAAFAAPVQAQQGGAQGGQPDSVGQAIDWVYAGVTPGSGHNPPRLAAIQRAMQRRRQAQLLTWPGFQLEGQASRFFLQTNAPVQTEARAEQGRYTVILKNTRVHVTNTRRALETEWFNTPVRRARVERRGRDLAFVMELRADVIPTIHTEPGQNGFQFIFVDFPPGDYLPERYRHTSINQLQERRHQQEGLTVAPATSNTDLTPELEDLDNEPPPGM